MILNITILIELSIYNTIIIIILINDIYNVLISIISPYLQ